MIVAAQQPYFAPYPGFFRPALDADVMVLLDGVQFPRGTTWITRNRFKSHDGTLWLTVPVWKKGRGLQTIADVEICNEVGWAHKHLESLKTAYRHAPYFDCHLPFLEELYHEGHDRLVPFNVAILRHLWNTVGLTTRLILQTDLRVRGTGSGLLIALCIALEAHTFVAQRAAGKYLDRDAFDHAGIDLRFVNPLPVVYPQLWGPFLPNLSMLDMLFACGPSVRRLLGPREGSAWHGEAGQRSSPRSIT